MSSWEKESKKYDINKLYREETDKLRPLFDRYVRPNQNHTYVTIYELTPEEEKQYGAKYFSYQGGCWHFYDEKKRLHRYGGPAEIERSRISWMLNGEFSRLDGPAYISPKVLTWVVRGKWHRTDGPAFVYRAMEDTTFFYINGKEMTREEYEKHFEIKESRIMDLVESPFRKHGHTFVDYKRLATPAEAAQKVYSVEETDDVIAYKNKAKRLNRVGGPALIRKHTQWGVLNKWYQNGKLHREDGPAVEAKNGSLKIWQKKGKYYRTNGPSVMDKLLNTEVWYNSNGVLHRTNGPAYTSDSIVSYSKNGFICNGPEGWAIKIKIESPKTSRYSVFPYIRSDFFARLPDGSLFDVRKLKVGTYTVEELNILSKGGVPTSSKQKISYEELISKKATGVFIVRISRFGVYEDCEVHLVDGILYNSDGGPSISGNTLNIWTDNKGNPHRIGGPAIVSDRTKEWFRHGVIYNPNGPSLISGDKSYWTNKKGELSNNKGPSFTDRDVEIYAKNGVVHREDGPAIINKSRTNSFNTNGASVFINTEIIQRLSFISASITCPPNTEMYVVNGKPIRRSEMTIHFDLKESKFIYLVNEVSS